MNSQVQHETPAGSPPASTRRERRSGGRGSNSGRNRNRNRNRNRGDHHNNNNNQSFYRANDLRQRGRGVGVGSASSSWRPASILLPGRPTTNITTTTTPTAAAVYLSERMRAYLRSGDDAMVGHLAVHPRAVADIYSRQRLITLQLAVHRAWAACQRLKHPLLNSSNSSGAVAGVYGAGGAEAVVQYTGTGTGTSTGTGERNDNNDNAQDGAAAFEAGGDCVMHDISDVGAQFYDADDDDTAAATGRDPAVEDMRAALAALEM
ncbi:hypothetical protein B0T24DRAFT_679524 [Lasiosphaeria ovina]|uniref:Uncharacterized protein n=1 Tax=Lasiosphaeria ovina TaxID=92902 RepID=A0AAE0N812_9PEZI|nr:hypothetical protein B0T24DRAFT_679524 [Lasiosphaeria ovina]